jgi:hypothetical protein
VGKCDRCPAADLPGPCWGPCHLLDRDPRYARIFRHRAGGEPYSDPCGGRPAAAVEIDPVDAAVDACPERLSCQCRSPIACRLYGAVTKADCRRCAAARLAGGPWRPRGAIDGPGVPSLGPPAGDAP